MEMKKQQKEKKAAAEAGEVVRFDEAGLPQLDVWLEDETIWLTQKQMGLLFGCAPQNITYHLREIYKIGELEAVSTCKEFLQVQIEGGRRMSRIQKFMNGFELDGKTQKVNVWTGKTATFAGALSDAVGGGALAVTGNLALDDATLEVGVANLSAPMLTVDGALTLDGTLNLALGATNEELAANGEVTLATATGGIGGMVAIAGNVPSNWTVLARANSLVLKKINGTVVIVR